MAQSRPNIVVFIADDVGTDLGCYGNPAVQTPHLDALARGGVRCTQAFLTSPQCSPSRTSMLSGQFAHSIGTEDLHAGIDSLTQLVPGYLAAAGYATGFMLKGHLGQHGERQFGWTDDGWEAYRRGVWDAGAARDFGAFIDQAGHQPFFLWMGFVDAHRPYGDSLNDAPAVHDPRKVQVPPYLVDAPATRRDLAAYYDEIHRMDQRIGEMMDTLARRDLLDNTVVIFLADNGFPFARGKGTLYDSGIRTPLIVQWPGHIAPGTVYLHLLSTIDLAPGLLDLAGLPQPPSMYGRSMVAQWQNPALPGRDYVFAERNWHDWDDYIRCVRTPRYKLIYNAYTDKMLGATDGYDSPAWEDLARAHRAGKLRPAQGQVFAMPRPMLELYDVVADPYELVNLAEQPQTYRAVIATLCDQLFAWQRETGDHDPHTRRLDDNTDRVTGARLGLPKPSHYYDD
ncbi:MAG: sulfatase [Bacteroidia bacterium]